MRPPPTGLSFHGSQPARRLRLRRALGLALRWLWRVLLAPFTPLVLLYDAIRPAPALPRPAAMGAALVTVIYTAGALVSGELMVARQQYVVRALTAFPSPAAVADLPYGDLIQLYAMRNGLDPALVASVVQAESEFDPLAISRSGARGLMQIMPDVWRWLYPESKCSLNDRRVDAGADCIFNPEANIRVGTQYLRWLIDQFEGDVALAFAAYNAGIGTVRRRGTPETGGLPPVPETQRYLRRIAGFWATLERSINPVDWTPADIQLYGQLRSVFALASLVSLFSLAVWVGVRLPRPASWWRRYG